MDPDPAKHGQGFRQPLKEQLGLRRHEFCQFLGIVCDLVFIAILLLFGLQQSQGDAGTRSIVAARSGLAVAAAETQRQQLIRDQGRPQRHERVLELHLFRKDTALVGIIMANAITIAVVVFVAAAVRVQQFQDLQSYPTAGYGCCSNGSSSSSKRRAIMLLLLLQHQAAPVTEFPKATRAPALRGRYDEGITHDCDRCIRRILRVTIAGWLPERTGKACFDLLQAQELLLNTVVVTIVVGDANATGTSFGSSCCCCCCCWLLPGW